MIEDPATKIFTAMSDRKAPDTNEEAAAKLPALHVMMVMGWEYLSPSDCLALRGAERSVVLEDVLREHLGRHRYDYKGQRLALSQNGMDQVVRDITSTGLSEGLLAANKAIYQHLTQRAATSRCDAL